MSFGETMFTVTDVKHYAYCPAIIYVKYVLGFRESTTEYMEMGREIHKEKIILPIIAKYKPAKILKNPLLTCKKLSLSGSPDYILIRENGFGVIVEVKWAEPPKRGVKRDHKLQSAAYSLLVDCCLKIPARIGVIFYLKPQPKLYEIPITGRLQREVKKILEDMKNIVENAAPLEPKIPWRRCISCNYKTFCPSKKPAPTHLHNREKPR